MLGRPPHPHPGPPSRRLLLQLQGGQNLGGGLMGTLPMSLPPRPPGFHGREGGSESINCSAGFQIWIEGAVTNPISFPRLDHDGPWAGASHWIFRTDPVLNKFTPTRFLLCAQAPGRLRSWSATPPPSPQCPPNLPVCLELWGLPRTRITFAGQPPQKAFQRTYPRPDRLNVAP